MNQSSFSPWLQHASKKYEDAIFYALNETLQTNRTEFLRYFVKHKIGPILSACWSDAQGRLASIPTHENVFVRHIERHLRENETVSCKICGKNIYTIFEEDIRNKTMPEEQCQKEQSEKQSESRLP